MAGEKEAESIVYRDEKFLLIPPLLRKKGSPDKKEYAPPGTYLLAIPMDRSLRSIRDLRREHKPLLKHIFDTTTAFMDKNYGVPKSQLEIEFHYTPSAYHLHMHFRKKDDRPHKASAVDSGINIVHKLTDVIKLINSDDLYFQRQSIEIMVKNKESWRNNLEAIKKRKSSDQVTDRNIDNYSYAISESELQVDLLNMIQSREVRLMIVISESEVYSGILCGFDREKVTLRSWSRYIQGSTKINVGNLFGGGSGGSGSGGSGGEAKEAFSSSASNNAVDKGEKVFEIIKILDIKDC